MTWYEVVLEAYRSLTNRCAYIYPSVWEVRSWLLQRGYQVGPNEWNEINRVFILIQAQAGMNRDNFDRYKDYERRTAGGGNIPPC